MIGLNSLNSLNLYHRSVEFPGVRSGGKGKLAYGAVLTEKISEYPSISGRIVDVYSDSGYGFWVVLLFHPGELALAPPPPYSRIEGETSYKLAHQLFVTGEESGFRAAEKQQSHAQ